MRRGCRPRSPNGCARSQRRSAPGSTTWAVSRAWRRLDEPRHRELDELRLRRGAPCSISDAVNDSTFQTMPLGAVARSPRTTHRGGMTAPRLSTALVLAMMGCLGHNDPPFVHPDPDPGQDQPPGGGSQSPPKIVRGPHKMSDVHVEPGGERVWIVHHGVGDLHANPNETAHFGVY